MPFLAPLRVDQRHAKTLFGEKKTHVVVALMSAQAKMALSKQKKAD